MGVAYAIKSSMLHVYVHTYVQDTVGAQRLSLGWWAGDGKRRQSSWLPTESPTYLHFK